VARHISISFSRRNPLFTSASKSWVLALDFFHSLFGFGRGGGEMSAVLTPGQIQPPHHGISSSRRWHQSSCSWTGKTSSSKCTGSSLASARGLLWWQAATARVDLWTTTREQGHRWMEWDRSISISCECGE
jgi:hypothetical protein